MIDGVLSKPLKIFPNEKGDVLCIVRCDDPFFTRFGEVYFSFIRPGFVKGWKKHLKQTQHFTVPTGQIKLVLYDDRPSSATKGQVQEIELGRAQYNLVRIPPQVWYSFGAVGTQEALIANYTDTPHDPAETVNLDITDKTVPYAWDLAKR